ncbi:MAG: hypothetical protein OXI59_22515 [Gemmatimonadota bacterium]|nr:hypothetical protein [Gemmatimonadota bacterium]
MTKEERLKNIDRGLFVIEKALEQPEGGRPTMMLGGPSPLEVMAIATIAQDTLQTLKALEETIDDKDNLTTFINYIATYVVLRQLALRTVGKKRLKRILKIGRKYIDKKILDPLEKAIDS